MYGHLRRGAAAGLVGGGAYGLYVALVGAPLTEYADAAAHGGGHAGEAGNHGLVGETAAHLVTVGGSVALGLLFGLVVFGVAGYLLEPALPERGGSYLLGLGGFLTVSGVPWLVLPPVAPGVESSLSTTTALYLYAGMVAAGAVACLSAGAAYRRLSGRGPVRAAVAALALFVAVAVVAVLLTPTVTYRGGVGAELAAAYTGVVVVGQLGLWGVTAAAHDRLDAATAGTSRVEPTPAD